MALPGSHLGRYRLLEEVGSGGMSVVYKGLDTALDREVAVKLLHPHLAQKPEARRRLWREALAVAQLHHPNIPEVYDFAGEDSDQAYLVTEFIRGKTLKEFVAREPLTPPELAAMVVHELAAALAQAHEAGILHRDLKPENVMVRDDGVLKLMDFGIAKILDRDDRMTQTGALVGSPAHMAPEIIEGLEGRTESDVFSLGTLLYFLLTQKLPFEGPNTTATLKRILDGAYDDPRQFAPAISDELLALLKNCLARDPQARFADARALQVALASCLAEAGVERVGEELSLFFADPAPYRQSLRDKLASRLFDKSERLLNTRPSAALSALNQLLALIPDHPKGNELLRRVGRSTRKKRRRLRLLMAMGGAALIASAVGALRVPRDLPHPRPQGEETALLLPQGTAPPLPQALPAKPAVHIAHRSPTLAKSISPLEPVRHAPVPVPFTVQIRPFGSVQLDGEPPSTAVLQRHLLHALPGRHRIRVSCPQYCEEAEDEVLISEEGNEVFHLGARAKPAHLSFAVEPEGAEVRIEDEWRPAKDTLTQPFLIRSARGPVRLEHSVSYQVRLTGYAPATGTLHLAPEETRTLSLQLLPQ